MKQTAKHIRLIFLSVLLVLSISLPTYASSLSWVSNHVNTDNLVQNILNGDSNAVSSNLGLYELHATKPGNNAAFPKATKNPTLSESFSNRFQLDQNTSQHVNEDTMLTGTLTFTPALIFYGTDGNMYAEIAVANPSGQDITLNGFYELTLLNSDNKPIFDSKDLTFDRPMVLKKDENELGSLWVFLLVAEPGTFQPNVDLTKFQNGMTQARPNYSKR